jgi:hypothetical protein
MEDRTRMNLAVDQGDSARLVVLVVLEGAQNRAVRAVLVDAPNGDFSIHA